VVVFNLCSLMLKMEVKKTIVILGDFHTRECARKMKDTVNKNVNVTHFVKRGSHIPILKSFC